MIWLRVAASAQYFFCSCRQTPDWTCRANANCCAGSRNRIMGEPERCEIFNQLSPVTDCILLILFLSGGSKWDKEKLAQKLEQGANTVKAVYR